MALKHIDQDGLYPGGKRGLPGRPTIAIVNENFLETEQRLSELEGGTGGVSAAIDALEQGQGVLQAGQSQLRAGLHDEADARSARDALLDQRIDAEQIARQVAHEALEARVGIIPGKNRLINGNFDFWQRGTSFAGNNTYTADRFFLQTAGATGAAIFRADVSPGDSNFPRSRYALNANSTGNTNAAGHLFCFEQRVEGVRNFSGEASTLSFSVYNAGAAGRKIAVEFVQAFGQGGSPAVLGIEPQVFTLAAGFNRVTKTVTLPTLAGKTVGPGSLAAVVFWLSAGTSFNARTASLGAQQGQLSFAEIQWEAGSTATSFEFRPLGVELALCQRYYEKSYDLDAVPGTAVNAGRESIAFQTVAGAGGWFSVGYRVTKRAPGAVTVWPAASSGATPAGSGAQNDSSLIGVGVEHTGQRGFNLTWINNAGKFGMWFQWAVDSEL